MVQYSVTSWLQCLLTVHCNMLKVCGYVVATVTVHNQDLRILTDIFL
jgi:hypothetical protein